MGPLCPEQTLELGWLTLMTLVAGGIIAITRPWSHRRPWLRRPPRLRLSPALDPIQIAAVGQYYLAAPGRRVSSAYFVDLHVEAGGIAWHDRITREDHYVAFEDIQWVSPATVADTGQASITLDLEIAHYWRLLTLQMPEADMNRLAALLRRTLSPANYPLNGRPGAHFGPVVARVAGQTLQGEITLGADVMLYVMPRLLLVLRGDLVQAKLDLSSIRRILAVERQHGPLDNLLKSAPDGMIRLHSMTETVAFALPDYIELAEELAYATGCSIEYVSRADKSQKGR